MTIKIFNTLKRKKEEFKPIKKGKVGMYVCGPTVYDEPHIGHARSVYVFDVIRRYLEYKDYRVDFIRNVTDIDDKIIYKAKEEFKDIDIEDAIKNVSQKYLDSYHKYMERLGIKKPSKEPKATEYVERMKDFIAKLIERGAAYESGGDVYFNIKKAKGYGKLSNQSLESLESGARVSPGENKSDPLDFALWKTSKEGEPSWDSPWGKGRPGWHIECSVMSSHILGDEFDIHGGGIDLIFPHHENEIAQSEGAGKRFARFWIHNGLLTINKEKMAKSLGNFVTIEEVLQRYSADVLKILFLQTHYSHPVDFSWDRMDEAKKAYDRIALLRAKLENIKEKRSKDKTIDGFRLRFEEAMDDDFNAAQALAVIFEMTSFINKNSENKEILSYTKKIFFQLVSIFGLFEGYEKIVDLDDSDKIAIEQMISERIEARKKKDYKKADDIRKKLEDKGISIKDTKDGTTWRIK